VPAKKDEGKENSKVDKQAIRERIKEREALIAQNFVLAEQEMTRLQQELQKEHQKVLYWEAKAKGAEKEHFNGLRLEIERQQKRLALPEQIVYQSTALRLAPKQTVVKNVVMAFLVGGTICLAGQVILNIFLQNGLAEKEAGAATSALLVFLGAFLTGLGYYDELGKVAGAGSIVPITGFANSIVSSAMEFKREGFVYGVGARLFTVAGPVIVYGTLVSILVGLIYFFINRANFTLL
jgi:stage V sporulation protein AC